MTALAELGIRLCRETPGQHRSGCPECARAKQRPRDDALAVKIEPEGSATWVCHRCGWKGALPAPGERYSRPIRYRPRPPRPEPVLPGFSLPAAVIRVVGGRS